MGTLARRPRNPCAARGPLALCAYLTERAAAGKANGTLNMTCVVVRHVHRMTGADDPVASEAVCQVRRALSRTYGAAPRRLARRPLTVQEIRQIVTGIDRTTPIGIRDDAIILLGYASATRRSELVALTLADVEDQPAGLLLHIRKSKTDQECLGQVVAVARGQHATTDPVAALNTWRAVRGGTNGSLFTRIWATTASEQPLGPDVVARMLRARAIAAGLDGTRITAHSLRAGDRAIQGTGLGLSIACSIVRSHGGDISAISAPGRGTQVTVDLPMAGRH